jgi:hypothetical protein
LSGTTAILRRASKRICSRAKGMSYRGMSLRISMTLINDSEQHVGRTAKVHERLCGSRHSLRSALRSPMRTLLPLSSFRRMTADCVSLQHVLAGTLKCGTHCNGDVALARTCPGVIPKNLRKAAPKADWLSKPAMAAALVGFSPTESAHIAAVRRAC